MLRGGALWLCLALLSPQVGEAAVRRPRRKPAPAPVAVPAPVKEIEPSPLVAAPAPIRSVPPVASPPPASTRPALALLGISGGPWLPLEVLGLGYRVGVLGQYRLPVMDGRLRATLGGGVQQAAAKLQAIIPGRGLDPAFIQNVTAGYLELGAEYELAAMEASALTVGASYSALPTFARFHALGTWTDTRALGHAANATLGYRRELGPGEAGVHLRFSLGGAALGPLSEIGTSGLTSLSLSFSYSFAFTPRGSTP